MNPGGKFATVGAGDGDLAVGDGRPLRFTSRMLREGQETHAQQGVEDNYGFAVQSRQEQLDQFTKQYFGDGFNVIYGGDQGSARFGRFVGPGEEFGGSVYDRPTIVVFEDAFRIGWGEVGTTILHEILEEYRAPGLSHEDIYELEKLWKLWYNQ